MIKAILVPATGSNTDNNVFASALAVARVFDAHLDFLHVHADAPAMAATMAADGSGAAMVTGLIERIEEDARGREEAAKQLFRRFFGGEELGIADNPSSRAGPSAGGGCHPRARGSWVGG